MDNKETRTFKMLKLSTAGEQSEAEFCFTNTWRKQEYNAEGNKIQKDPIQFNLIFHIILAYPKFVKFQIWRTKFCAVLQTHYDWRHKYRLFNSHATEVNE
jgi:hypothetical protein